MSWPLFSSRGISELGCDSVLKWCSTTSRCLVWLRLENAPNKYVPPKTASMQSSKTVTIIGWIRYKSHSTIRACSGLGARAYLSNVGGTQCSRVARW